MKLSELLLYLKVCGEATVTVESLKKMITCDDEDLDVKVLHIDPPITPEILSYYHRRKNDDSIW